MRREVILLFDGSGKKDRKKNGRNIYSGLRFVLFCEGDNRYITTQDIKNFLSSFKITELK